LAEPTVAIAVFEEVHVPPEVLFASAEDRPAHMFAVPVFADGAGITVTTVVAVQPVPVAVKVIVEVPTATEVT
jgi:hypothetical protein